MADIDPRLLSRLITTLDNIDRRLSQSRNTAISTVENISSLNLPGLLNVMEVPYKHHLFVRAQDKLQKSEQKYELQHPVDAVVVKGYADYQVEFDQNVNDQAPVIGALESYNASLRVNKYISYKIPQEYLDVYGDNVQEKFELWLYWY